MWFDQQVLFHDYEAVDMVDSLLASSRCLGKDKVFHVMRIDARPRVGHVQTESKSKVVNRNENGKGADWCLVQTCSLVFRFGKNAPSTTDCQNQKVER